MNPYALSDFVLAFACVAIVVRTARAQPAMALACATIGVAACAGVLRFSGYEEVLGAHKFLSLIGGIAGLPLLAIWAWAPESKVAENWREAALAFVVFCAIGMALVAGAGFALWGKLVPAASGLAIFGGMLYRDKPSGVFGGLLLLLAFASISMNLTHVGPFAPLEALHYGMAVALLLVCL